MADKIVELQDVLDYHYEYPTDRDALRKLLSAITTLLSQINERFGGRDNGEVNLQIREEEPSYLNPRTFYADIRKSDLLQTYDSPLYNPQAQWNESVMKIIRRLALITDEPSNSTYQIIENENTSKETKEAPLRIIFLDNDSPFQGAIELLLTPNDAISYKGQSYQLCYRIKDLTKADAGYSFNISDEMPWVIPFHNRIGSPYTQERTDEILSALTNLDFLKQTCEDKKDGIKAYVNLLTDLYERDVEVEDLDRNFWVISQVISAIINYLFGKNGTIDTLEELLNEISQLWQNIIYLWEIVGDEKEKSELPTHTEIIYLSTGQQDYAEINRQFRYDLGASVVENSYFTDFSRMIKQEYVGCNLIIVPILRRDYYEENYYQTEEVPFIYYYNRLKNEEKKFYFKWSDKKEKVFEGLKKGVIPKDGKSLLFTLKDNNSFDSIMHEYYDVPEEWTQYACEEGGEYNLLKISYGINKEDSFVAGIETVEPDELIEGKRITHYIYKVNLKDLEEKEDESELEVETVPSRQFGVPLEENKLKVSYYQGELLSRRCINEQIST